MTKQKFEGIEIIIAQIMPLLKMFYETGAAIELEIEQSKSNSDEAGNHLGTDKVKVKLNIE